MLYMATSVLHSIHLLSLARIEVLAVIRLSYSILILLFLFACNAFLSELLCFGIVCLLLLYWLKIFTCSKSY